MTERRNKQNFVYSLLYANKNIKSKALLWGKDNELRAKK